MRKYRIKINGHVYETEIEVIDEKGVTPTQNPLPVEKKPQQTVASAAPVAKQNAAQPKNSAPADGRVCSFLPGVVTKILCSEGDRVKAGQVVLIIEAMKMENEVTAPKDGIVKNLTVTHGARVVAGEALFVVEEAKA